jgi:phage recombination protein Bet
MTEALAIYEPDPQELDIFRKHFAPAQTTNDEWSIFLETCRTYRLSPMRKQIYLVSRYDGQKKRQVATPQISIGGLRALALRTREFEGTTEPEWGDKEGNWYKLWPEAKGPHPYAARIGVYRRGFRAPVWGVAYFHELAQKTKEGNLTRFWQTMGLHMISKCALANALRGAFEEEVGGLYIHEEMNQADADGAVVNVIPVVDQDDQGTNEALKETVRQQTPAPVSSPTNAAPQARSNGTAKPASAQPVTVDPGNVPPSAAAIRHRVEAEKPKDPQTGKAMNWPTFLSYAFADKIRVGQTTVPKLMQLGDEFGPDQCTVMAAALQKLTSQAA